MALARLTARDEIRERASKALAAAGYTLRRGPKGLLISPWLISADIAVEHGMWVFSVQDCKLGQERC